MDSPYKTTWRWPVYRSKHVAHDLKQISLPDVPVFSLLGDKGLGDEYERHVQMLAERLR